MNGNVPSGPDGHKQGDARLLGMQPHNKQGEEMARRAKKEPKRKPVARERGDQKSTSGPWTAKPLRLIPGAWEVSSNTGSSVGELVIHVLPDKRVVTPQNTEADARLIASAPAQAIALEMLALGIARLERIGTLIEFCFDGLRYSVPSTGYGDLIGFVGWDRCRAAIAKAKVASKNLTC